MGSIDIDPESLRKGADQLDQAKETVRAQYEQFKTGAEALFDAFGGDDIGSILSEAHDACLEAARECFETNIAGLEDYAECLRAFADDYQAADDDAAADFDALFAGFAPQRSAQ
jgi:uncharacterized protein YukE